MDEIICNRHHYIVVSWDGDEARKLMCAHCLSLISYKDVKFRNKKQANVIYDIEDDLQE